MHNGAFATLRDVVVHYNNIELSLRDYTPWSTEEIFKKNFLVDKHDRNFARFNNVDIPVRRPLDLTQQEINHLVEFMKGALTDPKFIP